MKNIILFNGGSAYFAHHVATDHLSKAFIRLGYHTKIFDLEDKNIISQIDDDLQKTEFVFSFNGRGGDLRYNENEYLYDVHNIPFVFALGDHPIYHLDRLGKCSNNCLLLCHDLSHYNALLANKELTEKFNMISLTEEHAYFSLLEELDESYEQFYNRPIDILFPCSCHNLPPIFEMLEKLPQQLKKICFSIIDVGITDDYHSIDEIVKIVFEKEKITLNDKLNSKMSQILMQVDFFIRGYRREQCVLRLLEKGLTVHVCGNGWERFAVQPGENLVIHDVKHNNETLALIRQSKVVVNIGPLWPNSVHERVLTSMNLGAAVLSDRNFCYDKNFKHDENILLFASKDVNQVPILLTEYLADLPRLFSIAKTGREHVQRNFSWDKYAKKIIQLIEMYKNINS